MSTLEIKSIETQINELKVKLEEENKKVERETKYLGRLNNFLKEYEMKKDSMDLILTGRNLPDEVREIADCVYSIQREKEKTPEILAHGNF